MKQLFFSIALALAYFFQPGEAQAFAFSVNITGPTTCVPARTRTTYTITFNEPETLSGACKYLRVAFAKGSGILTYTNPQTGESTSGSILCLKNNNEGCVDNECNGNSGIIDFLSPVSIMVTWNAPAGSDFIGTLRVEVADAKKTYPPSSLDVELLPRKPVDISVQNLNCTGGDFTAVIPGTPCGLGTVRYRWWKKTPNDNDFVLVSNGDLSPTRYISTDFNQNVTIRVATVTGSGTPAEAVSATYQETFTVGNTPTYIVGPEMISMPSTHTYSLNKLPNSTQWTVSPGYPYSYIVASTPQDCAINFVGGSVYSYTITSVSQTNCNGQVINFKNVFRSYNFDSPGGDSSDAAQAESGQSADRSDPNQTPFKAPDFQCQPNQWYLFFEGAESEKSVAVLDMSGKLVYSRVFNENELTIDTAPFALGIYVLAVRSNGVQTVHKLPVLR